MPLPAREHSAVRRSGLCHYRRCCYRWLDKTSISPSISSAISLATAPGSFPAPGLFENTATNRSSSSTCPLAVEKPNTSNVENDLQPIHTAPMAACRFTNPQAISIIRLFPSNDATSKNRRGPRFEYACHEGNIGLYGILAGTSNSDTQRVPVP